MPVCRDCGYPILEDMIICGTCGKALGAPRFCVDCNERISQERFDNYQGRCKGCSRKSRMLKFLGLILVLAGFIGICFGLWLAFSSGILGFVNIIAIAVSAVCGILFVIGLILLYLGFRE